MALRPYLELVRLPAVFTAPSDVLAGAAIAAAFGRPASAGAVAALVGASAALYCAGMAANDVCDLRVDRAERPKRPLPSGRVTLGAAWALVLLLQGVAVAIASFVGREAVVAVAATAAATWLYNGALKGGPLGPAAMGLCRYANATIGLAAAGAWPTAPLAWAIPVGTLAYTAAVTSVSGHEAAGATRAEILPRAAVLLGLALVPALWPVADLLPVRWAAALVVVPLAWLWRPARRAVATPTPGAVRGLVMAGIFGIAMLNGVIAVAAGGFVAAAIAVGLLVPGRLFGRWFYAT